MKQNALICSALADLFREEMEYDMAALNELQLAIYVFHEAVSDILRQNHMSHIQPHWMFAVDNLLRSAVQAAITIVSPELGANIAGNTTAPLPDQQEEESTSGVSTFDSSHRPQDTSHYDRVDNRELYGQLRDLEEENRK